MSDVKHGRAEHTLHELLNNLLEYPEEYKSILDDLRNACEPISRTVQVVDLGHQPITLVLATP